MDSSVIKDEKSRFHLNTTAELLKYDLYVPSFSGDDLSGCLSIFLLLVGFNFLINYVEP